MKNQMTVNIERRDKLLATQLFVPTSTNILSLKETEYLFYPFILGDNSVGWFIKESGKATVKISFDIVKDNIPRKILEELIFHLDLIR